MNEAGLPVLLASALRPSVREREATCLLSQTDSMELQLDPVHAPNGLAYASASSMPTPFKTVDV